VTGAVVDRQWIAVDDNGGTSARGSGSADGRGYLFYDNAAQNTSSSNASGNSPVVNATTDGVHYGGCVDGGATVCKAPAAVISAEDDIVGNAFVDDNPTSPRYHAVDEVRGSSNSHKVLFSTCRGAKVGKPTTAAETAAACTNPTMVAARDSGMVNINWSDRTVAALPAGYVAKSFDVGAIDTAGNVYVTWAQYKLDDYLQVKTGTNGEAVLSYVDDTSGNRNNDITQGSGEDPPEASGPTMSAHQISGPSLYASKGSVGNGTAAVGAVTDPVDKGFPDAYLALAGTNADSSKALDIAGVSITQVDTGHLSITLTTADPKLASDLAPSPAPGGLFANWRVRWAGRYGTSGKDGQIYYVGMQAGQDGTPEYYVGKTASVDTTRTKYYAYPTDNKVPGKITGGRSHGRCP